MTLSHRLNGTSMYDSIAVRWIDNDIPSNNGLGPPPAWKDGPNLTR
jgi:hypothetical protein